MKKLIFLFIVLFNISSYSITITIIGEDATPLKEVIANINNQVKISDSIGQVTFDTSEEILNISISKEGYKEEVLTLKNSIDGIQNFTLVMKQLNTSYVTLEFPVSDGLIEYREVGASRYTKVPFLGGFKSMEFLSGTYEFIFSAKNSIKNKQILNFKDRSEHFFIDIDIPKNKFFILGNTSKNKGIKFYEDNIGKVVPLKNLTLVIFQNGKIIKKIKLKDTFVPVELEDGVYDFMVEDRFYSDLYFRGLKLNSAVNKNIVISIPSVQTTIRGVIKNKDQFIGGAKISFTDVGNNSYETMSSFAGEFSINLPPQKYKITLKKPGFILEKNQNLIYDFTALEEVYNLILNTEELPSNVEGIVTDDKGRPISNADIMVKNGDEIIHLKSGDFGNFSTPILPGLLFIKVEKDGYKAFGVVTKLERFSTLSGLKISLTPYLSNISGIIGNSFTPLSNLHLTLMNRQGEVVANTISNQNGYYEFSDIKINESYFISVGVQPYKYYYSDVFTLTKDDLTNKNIILQGRKIRVYLEFLNNSKTPLRNKEIMVEGTAYKTDTNGFLLLELPENMKNIDINVKSYGYQKQIDLTSMSTNPNQLTIIIE
ncbi:MULTISPECIES: carboxypeptidase-like regulatory domain-containing protein [Psychrilyobacter]|uniref:Carboxypeptidase regulatory-like domain-containing protein n=1 Tax=Psychrilyobacter piezotolerans TaxID=2293438 RepID=A0ABX9KEE4_9FUSO|nr:MULTISPECIES: carboxypeptidase-like regulatory domain-containing protein [Psychrilyobacter]MCS5422679.1 carboxypeptidase-like regulatory domain-containing protein [Psychrilyobacter sp. S5]NDI78974.1 carboxypeptidase regulatory-like domain-containing protein [Psychrilyobacter piezotolerans]RDE59197.1 carboxypeptidase regulatory-like domain-containing protein [Psychrilyobacter sp. S5]REI39764.1 carboxypeptidase regulatory-like domain-containing protein [Psychrilyobacter piezotolerans]